MKPPKNFTPAEIGRRNERIIFLKSHILLTQQKQQSEQNND